jgi:hypothetical protein
MPQTLSAVKHYSTYVHFKQRSDSMMREGGEDSLEGVLPGPT